MLKDRKTNLSTFNYMKLHGYLTFMAADYKKIIIKLPFDRLPEVLCQLSLCDQDKLKQKVMFSKQHQKKKGNSLFYVTSVFANA